MILGSHGADYGETQQDRHHMSDACRDHAAAHVRRPRKKIPVQSLNNTINDGESPLAASMDIFRQAPVSRSSRCNPTSVPDYSWVCKNPSFT